MFNKKTGLLLVRPVNSAKVTLLLICLYFLVEKTAVQFIIFFKLFSKIHIYHFCFLLIISLFSSLRVLLIEDLE